MTDWITSAWNSVVSTIYTEEDSNKQTILEDNEIQNSIISDNIKDDLQLQEIINNELNKNEEDFLPDILMLTLNECFIYKIPPLTTSSGYYANDWNLESPLVTGSLRVFKKIDVLYLRLYTVNPAPPLSEEKDKVFGECILEELIECKDSSRYFVLRISPPNVLDFKNINNNKNKFGKFTGFGFRERDTAFDLKNTIQDHLRYLERCEEADLLKINGNELTLKNDSDEISSCNHSSSLNSIHAIKEGNKLSLKNFISPNKEKSRQKEKSLGSVPTFLPPPPTNNLKINLSEHQDLIKQKKEDKEEEEEEWGDFTSS